MAWLLGIRARPDPKEMFLGSKDDISDPSPSLSSSSFLFLFSFGEEYWVSFDRTTIPFVTWGPLGTPISRQALCSFLHRTQVERRAGLETFGLVHEHNVVKFFTSHVRCQKLPKKRAPKIHMVAPITMAAMPADTAGGGSLGVAALSARTTTAEVSFF